MYWVSYPDSGRREVEESGGTCSSGLEVLGELKAGLNVPLEKIAVWLMTSFPS